MVISAAHSSRLVLRSDDEAEGDDDSSPESVVCDETPEEQVNDDGQAEVQDETESVEESEGNPQDKTKSVVDNLSNADDEELPMEIDSIDRDCVEEEIQNELVSQIHEKILEMPHLISVLLE